MFSFYIDLADLIESLIKISIYQNKISKLLFTEKYDAQPNFSLPYFDFRPLQPKTPQTFAAGGLEKIPSPKERRRRAAPRTRKKEEKSVLGSRAPRPLSGRRITEGSSSISPKKKSDVRRAALSRALLFHRRNFSKGPFFPRASGALARKGTPRPPPYSPVREKKNRCMVLGRG